jgi:formimidoylglutamate deiminase
LPELVYVNGEFRSNVAVVCDDSGRVVCLLPADEIRRQAEAYRTLVSLEGKALLPGLVNAHSHAFQRVIRGRTEYRSQRSTDSFWTWRELMYAAANKLDVNDIYLASRMAFLEMVLSGITAVASFITSIVLRTVKLTKIQICWRRK